MPVQPAIKAFPFSFLSACFGIYYLFVIIPQAPAIYNSNMHFLKTGFDTIETYFFRDIIFSIEVLYTFFEKEIIEWHL